MGSYSVKVGGRKDLKKVAFILIFKRNDNFFHL